MAASTNSAAAKIEQNHALLRPVIDLELAEPNAADTQHESINWDEGTGPIGGTDIHDNFNYERFQAGLSQQLFVCEQCGCGSTRDLPPPAEMCTRCFMVHYADSTPTPPDAAPSTPDPAKVQAGASAAEIPSEAKPAGASAEETPSEAKPAVASAEETLSEAKRGAASGEETGSESGRAAQAKFAVHNVSVLDSSVALQADIGDVAPLCVKCHYPVHEVFRAKVYGKKGNVPTLVCRKCNNAMTMLAKRVDVGKMGEAGLDIASFTEEEAETFFREAGRCVDESGALVWAALRNHVCATFTHRKMSSISISLSERELPLSVWAKKGFDVSLIQSSGKKCAHPVFGEVWSVPLKTTTQDEVILVYAL